jgi:ribonuclease E
LSLAGRYCVLMPNTTHGGGISRKISNSADRKRLKSVLSELNLPSTMGCIVRTAGVQRTKTEIKRDFDYLARLWDGIREKTLSSTAPALIHEDSDLIRRAIRDIYNKDIDEVIVEGEDGYRHAREFMKLLMPSHAKKVKAYADAVPLYQRYGVEDQLAAMYNPVVQLKSGGYLVINPTEALVSIDINSGRSTREHGIEATAVGTNLEAAQEIARQLRLRDMAGLVVIDFIDMEHYSNIRKVEKAMKIALTNDRARIQVGRISSFGLMEMSRQRLRTGVLEASTRTCPHCEGSGLVRTASSAGLSALRMLEEEAARGHGSRITLRASQEAAFYVLNNKRAELAEIEARYGVMIEILSDGEIEGARMGVEASGPPPAFRPEFEPIIDEDDDIEDDIVDEDEEEEAEEREARDSGRRGKRRRRGRRGRRDEPANEGAETDADASDDSADDGEEASSEGAEAGGDEPKRKRRGRRGGRRRRSNRDEGTSQEAADEGSDAESPAEEVFEAEVEAPPAKPKRGRKKAAEVEAEAVVEAEQPVAEVAEKPKRGRRKKAEEVEGAPETEPAPLAEAPVEEAKPKRSRKKKVEEADAAPAQVAVADAEGADASPPRRGWWQRTFGAEEA